jgi:Tfp pilus assembly protein PilV
MPFIRTSSLFLPCRHLKSRRAFSLVEVVLALGVGSFAIISLIGLFAFVLKINQESNQTVLAANLASTLLAQNRMLPTNSVAGNTSPIPRLDQASSNFIVSSYQVLSPVYLTAGGEETNNVSYASYGMLYQVTPNATANASQVYVMLYWPPQSSPVTSLGKYEISTQILLP